MLTMHGLVPGLLLVLGLCACSGGSEEPAGSVGGGSSATSGGASGSVAGSSTGTTGGTSRGGTSTAEAGTSNAGSASQAGSATAGGATSGGTSGTGTPPMTGPIDCRKKGDGKSTITLVNHCTETLSFAGSDIQGGELAPGEHACRDVGSDVESIPAIRFWGYIGQDPGGERYTLAELTLNTDFNDFDWYNISHVDASNLPMAVSAVEMPNCRTLSCPNSLLADCPEVGKLKDASGKFDASTWLMLYQSKSLKSVLRVSSNDAYSWSGDDQDSVVACAGEDYDVVLCP
jgi:hypothetical protein